MEPHDRTTQRYAHLANDVVRDGLEAATDRIVGATRGALVLTLPPFERLSERQWKRIAAIMEATRGTCGGKRTDLRRPWTRSAEPRHVPRGAARSKPTIDVEAVEVGPSTTRQGSGGAPPLRLTPGRRYTS